MDRVKSLQYCDGDFCSSLQNLLRKTLVMKNCSIAREGVEKKDVKDET